MTITAEKQLLKACRRAEEVLRILARAYYDGPALDRAAELRTRLRNIVMSAEEKNR